MRVHELYEDKTACYIVTELLTGGELYDQIIELDFFSETHAQTIARQCVSALSALHAIDVVHRDIKPENILLTSKDGQPFIKVVDFGFAVIQPKEGMTEAIGTPYYVAPEVLSGSRYDKKCDVWSMGVVTFVMLSGRTPFNADNLAGIAKEIRSCNYTFNYPEFEQVSDASKDFIRTCLKVNPAERVSMSDLLNHKWLSENVKGLFTDAEKQEHREALYRNLAKFSKGDKFQQGIITFIIHSLGQDEETSALGNLFATLDSSGDGKLTAAELLEGLQIVFGLDPAAVNAESVMAAMDVDKDGRIDYSEFLSATMNHEKLLNNDNLAKVFHYLDVDNNGEVSYEELLSKLDAAGLSRRNKDVWDRILAEADANGDKVLSEKEFILQMNKFLNHSQTLRSVIPSKE